MNTEMGSSPSRRQLLATTGALFAAADAGVGTAAAQPARPASPAASGTPKANGALHRQKLVGFMLGHEQFTVPQLVEAGKVATESGFNLLATSDHFQPWQANEGHCGEAWVTLGALGGQARAQWMGTTVTCPTMRYHPAVVAEAFASLAALYPGRVFLGVGSGEALNEQAATGMWPGWVERWERLAEAIAIIRGLWTGRPFQQQGKYYTVDAKLYDPPPQPIPLLTAANGKKSMRLAGTHGDGLITDPMTWKKHKDEWEAGAGEAGKDPAQMPVLVEQFVVVGDREAAARAAEKWRFIPKAFKKYYNIADPAEIQRQAENDLPLDNVFAEWPVGTDPGPHIDAIERLFAAGASIVNIHSGQDDQKKVIDFYGRSVLPKLNLRT